MDITNSINNNNYQFFGSIDEGSFIELEGQEASVDVVMEEAEEKGADIVSSIASEKRMLSLEVLSTKSSDMNKPNPNGPLLQRFHDYIYMRLRDPKHPEEIKWIQAYMSPRSREAGPCLYKIGTRDANGEINDEAPLYVGGTDRNLLIRTEEHLREAADYKNSKGCRKLNEQLRKLSDLRVKLFKDFGKSTDVDVWKEEHNEIIKRKKNKFDDWNIKSTIQYNSKNNFTNKLKPTLIDKFISSFKNKNK